MFYFIAASILLEVKAINPEGSTSRPLIRSCKNQRLKLIVAWRRTSSVTTCLSTQHKHINGAEQEVTTRRRK